MSHGIAILNHAPALNPLIAVAVLGATIVTDAVYVQFTAAVATRQRLRAANWSGLWYVLSAIAVINYTAIPPMWCSPRSAPGSALLFRSPSSIVGLRLLRHCSRSRHEQ